ncbi:MAG: hypothetical protein WCQ64_08770 [Acidobacteriota bacterium]
MAVILTAGAVAVSANDDKKPSSGLTAAIIKAADNQLAHEGTFANGDTGAGVLTCSWEWQAGSGWAYANTQAPSARGLLAAYEVTEKSKYLKGAVCAGNRLVAALDANPTERPFSEDVIFLTELAKATDNKLFAKRAVAYHARTRLRYATGTILADYYIGRRLSLSGWDLSSQIEAAVAVGQDGYARAIAERIIEKRASWEGVLYGGWDYTGMSRGALVGALASFEGKTIKKFRDEARTLTLAAQGADGSWDADFQNTAFALMGLAAGQKSDSVQGATRRGINYLLTTQAATGGWVWDGWGESPEANGEVLSALCRFAREHGDDDRDDR